MTVEKGKSVQLELGLDPAFPLIGAYLDLFEPRAYQPREGTTGEVGQPRFSGLFLMPEGHPGAATIFNTAMEVAEANWDGVVTRDANGAVSNYIRTAGMFSWPFMFGAEYADADQARKREEFRPYFILKAGASATRPPGLSILVEDGVFDIPSDTTRMSYADKFYGGVNCAVRVGIAPRKQGGAGVTAYLNIVVSYGTGQKNDKFSRSTGGSGSAMFSGHHGVVRMGSPLASPRPPAIVQAIISR